VKTKSENYYLLDVEGLVAHLDMMNRDEFAAAYSGQLHAELAKTDAPIWARDEMIAGQIRPKAKT